MTPPPCLMKHVCCYMFLVIKWFNESQKYWNNDSHSILHTNNLHLCACVLSHVWLSSTPWTVAHQTPLSMWFSRQEHWSGLLCPPPGDLPDPGIEPASLKSPALAGRIFITGATWEAQGSLYSRLKTFELCWIMWLLESLTWGGNWACLKPLLACRGALLGLHNVFVLLIFIYF